MAKKETVKYNYQYDKNDIVLMHMNDINQS